MIKAKMVNKIIVRIFLEVKRVNCRLLNIKIIITKIIACRPKIPFKESTNKPAKEAKE